MLFLAVSGAVVTVVWLAVMRGSAQRARPFIPQAEPRGQTGTPSSPGVHPPSQTGVGGSPQVSALRDATIAEADNEEALAAAAALWGVLFQHRT